MAVTFSMFAQFVGALGDSTTGPVLGTDTLRVIACTNITGLSAVQATAGTMTAVKAAGSFAEVTNAAGGSSYVFNSNSTSSGLSLGAGTFTRSSLTWTLTSATAITWTTAAAGFAPTGLVFFVSLGAADATSIPIGWADLGGAQAGTGGSWTYTLPAGGITQGVVV